MAVDKLVDSTQLESDLTDIANAIRTKGGTSASLAFPADFVSAVEAISGGSATPRLIDQMTITMTSTASSSSKETVQLTPATNCAVVVVIDEIPAPPADGYTALAYANIFTKYGNGATFSAILRAAGTVGTDNGMCTFTNTTGELKLGGQYGYFRAGMTYNIYEFEMGAGS